MSDPWSNYSLNGCLFEQTPSAAPSLSVGSTHLPQLVDLRKFCSPVEDQKTTNSCVANAVVGALEFHQIKAGLRLTDLSRLFVYYNARALSDMQAKDSGTQIHHGMAAILAHGACEARLWPFEMAMLTTKPTMAAYQNATHYEAVQYARTPIGTPALTVLAQGLPIVFGMFAPREYYEVAARTGVMPKPSGPPNSAPAMGHAMLIVGYDLSDKTYLVRNSYGAAWADKGYFKMPFETVEAFARKEDFWTIGAIEQAPALSLMGPSIAEAMEGVGVSLPQIEAMSKRIAAQRSDLRKQLTDDIAAAKRDFRSRIRGD